jgi:hypothetical protein
MNNTTETRTDLHGHYCTRCAGYAPCWGAYPENGVCLLTDSCVHCGLVLDGTPPIRIRVEAKVTA